MAKYLKRLLFWLFILLLVVLMGYLGYRTYIQANSSKAVNYLLEKYEIKEKDLKTLNFEEYVYSDITNCDSLWFKKCSDDENLLYSFEIEIKGKDIINVKEYKGKIFEDDYEEGKIRDEYKEKLEQESKEDINLEDKVEAN